MDIFRDNKWTTYYFQLIQKHGVSEKPVDGRYYERHHIIPKCFGGHDNRTNLIYLTGRAHFMAHAILCYAVKSEHRRKAVCAMVCFRLHGIRRTTAHKIYSRAFERLRKEFSAHLKESKWYNNGITNVRVFKDEIAPLGYSLGRVNLPSRQKNKIYHKWHNY